MLQFIVVLTMGNTGSVVDRKEQKKQILDTLNALCFVNTNGKSVPFDNAIGKFYEIYNALKVQIDSTGLKGDLKRVLLIALLEQYKNMLTNCKDTQKSIDAGLLSDKHILIKYRNSSAFIRHKQANDATNVSRLSDNIHNKVIEGNTNTIKLLAYEYIMSKIQNKL